jgi:hypothetical protein
MDVSMGSFAITFLFESIDIQIFNADDTAFVDVHPGKRMKEIGSLVIGSLRGFIQLIPKFLAIIRAILSPGKPSLDTLNLDGGLLRKPWILYRIFLCIFTSIGTGDFIALCAAHR